MRKKAILRHEVTKLRKIENFTVIPSSTFKRHHIRIDNAAFYYILREVDCKHKRFLRKNGEPKARNEMKPNDYNELWKHYFDIEKMERTPENDYCARIEFDNFVETDGVAISFVMKRTKFILEEDEEEHKQKLQHLLQGAEQVYALDTGLRLVYAGIRRNRDGTEDNIRLTSKHYHHLTGYRKRQKRLSKLTRIIDDKMRDHRETFAEQPGPRSEDYNVYADHILRHFNEKFKAYTQYEYALQDFLQYVETNRAIDQLINGLIGGKKTFVFVGDAFLPGNSPAKGYVRSKVRLLFERMGRRRNCTVFGVDEFRTTKLCSFCFRELDQPTKNGQVKKKYRYYTCRGCVKVPEANESAGRIHSRKTNRMLTEQRQTVPRPGIRMASKFRRYEQRSANGRNITWNRDINAGRNMYYKGLINFNEEIDSINCK